jgi:XTP/dITP diphosphohydrolase
MPTLVIATRNRHKVGEIQSILGAEFRCLSQQDFPGAPAAIEDAPTFAGNAVKKAATLADWLARAPSRPPGRVLVLADDSGLEVDALDGAPGVHSARFAALDAGAGAAPGHDNCSDADNNQKLLRLLEKFPAERRTARFRCVLALVELSGADVAGRAEVFEGVCEGRIQQAPAGQGGFGYDPLFVPEGHALSFAELGTEVKNTISHRARALTRLKARLAGGGPGSGT